MATATFHGVMGCSSDGQWGYYGGSSYAANQWGYVDYTGYGYKTRAKITVAPDSNKKITDITVTVTVRRNGNTNLLAYLCTSEATSAAGATTSAPTSYITTAREVTPNNNANPGYGTTQWSFTFHGLNVTSSTVYYVWWQTATNISGSLTEICDGYQSTPRGSVTLTQVSLTSSISYNGNGYTGGTLPGSGNYNIGSSYTISSNTLTHSDTNGYVISFNSNGGGTAPSAITQKIGWTHDYWTLNSTSGTRYNKGASFTVPSSASTFYAHWATSRRAITLPTAPSAPTGKYFIGWYTASSGGSKTGNAGASWTPDTTRTLYAQWAWNTYTVSYNGNGYTGGTLPGNQTKTYGTNLTLSSNNLTKSSTSLTGFTVTFNKNGGNNPSVASITNTRSTSYSHNGWRLNGTSGTLYSKGGTYSTNAAAIFYASWSTTTNNGQITTATCTKNSSTSSCIVYFNASANGGSCSTSSLSSNRTTTYTCTGWWTETSGGTRRTTNGGKYTPTTSETVYAQWSSSTGEYSAITLPTASKTGYTFAGWATSSTATSGITGNYIPTGTITLYAIFKQSIYTLTIHKNGSYQGISNTTTDDQINLSSAQTYNIQDGWKLGWIWGGWQWSGGYAWKDFGDSIYCAHPTPNGFISARTGSYREAQYIQIRSYNNDATDRPSTISYSNYIMTIAYSASSGNNKAFGFCGPLLKNPNKITTMNCVKKNTRWIHFFRAQLPKGYYWRPTFNSIGNSQWKWLTPWAGAGDMRNYAYEITFGTTGTYSTADSTIGFVGVSTSNNSFTPPSAAVTIKINYSILYAAPEVCFNRQLTMPSYNLDIYAQGTTNRFFYRIETGNNGNLDVSTRTSTYYYSGANFSLSQPTRANYTFLNWDRIMAPFFVQYYRFYNNTSGNNFTAFKILIYNLEGTSLLATVVSNTQSVSNSITVFNQWQCSLPSGIYWIHYGMAGSIKDHYLYEKIYLNNNVTYGYYWESDVDTAQQNIRINYLHLGPLDNTTQTEYTNQTVGLMLKANWTANASIHINANGGWLNPAGYASDFTNDTVTPLGRVNYSGSVYTHSLAYGSSADLADWNNPEWLNLIRFGYSVPTGEQYYNSAGAYFEHNTLYTAQTYVPALTSSSPAEGDVYVNWQPNDYTFTLQRQDTTIASSVVENYGQIVQLPEDHKDYHTFMGWFREFSGADFVQLGRDYMYTDKIAVHLTAYRDDWSTFDNGMKLISCTEGGGWNIEGTNDWTQASGYESSVGYNVSPKLMFGLNSLTPGFHDFDIVFTGTQYQFWIDDNYAGATTWSHPIGYYVTANTCNQILVGKEASSFASNRLDAAEPAAPAFIGYIGNVVIAHQNTRIDATAARTQWNTPVHNITLQSLFRENPYIKVHLNIGNGIVVDENNNIYHNGDVIKFYYEDNPQKTFMCYPPTAQMITSTVIRNDLTNIVTNATTVGTPITTSFQDGELIVSQDIQGNANAYVNVYFSMTYANIPVLRYQYLLVDDNDNNIIDNNGNNIKVTLKYIPYRYNGSTWQRCEPRGYSNGWKLGE